MPSSSFAAVMASAEASGTTETLVSFPKLVDPMGSRQRRSRE